MRLVRVFPKDGTAVFHCFSHLIPELGLLDNEERDRFQEMIYRRAEFCGLEVMTHCVMGNHFHLLIQPKPVPELNEEGLFLRAKALYGEGHRQFKKLQRLREATGKLPSWIQQGLTARIGEVSVYLKELKEGFSRWYNKRHGRKGTIWIERFGSTIIQAKTNAVFSVAAYIDLNPVRAGLVSIPEEYGWSGLTAAIQGKQEAQTGIQSLFGNEMSWNQAFQEYRARVYISGGVVHQPGKVALEDETIQKVWDQTFDHEGMDPKIRKNRYFTQGKALGTADFVDEIFEVHWKGRYSQREEGSVEIGNGIPGLEGCFAYAKISDPHSIEK